MSFCLFGRDDADLNKSERFKVVGGITTGGWGICDAGLCGAGGRTGWVGVVEALSSPDALNCAIKGFSAPLATGGCTVGCGGETCAGAWYMLLACACLLRSTEASKFARRLVEGGSVAGNGGT